MVYKSAVVALGIIFIIMLIQLVVSSVVLSGVKIENLALAGALISGISLLAIGVIANYYDNKGW
jgi:xanthine/uracil/vitamin C permease (AzgA family)